MAPYPHAKGPACVTLFRHTHRNGRLRPMRFAHVTAFAIPRRWPTAALSVWLQGPAQGAVPLLCDPISPGIASGDAVQA